MAAKFRILDPDLQTVREGVLMMHSSRAMENEFCSVFHEVVLPKPGRYSVEFLMDGQLLQTSRLDVRSIQQQDSQ
jgi:hypothetical protein